MFQTTPNPTVTTVAVTLVAVCAVATAVLYFAAQYGSAAATATVVAFGGLWLLSRFPD